MFAGILNVGGVEERGGEGGGGDRGRAEDEDDADLDSRRDCDGPVTDGDDDRLDLDVFAVDGD